MINSPIPWMDRDGLNCPINPCRNFVSKTSDCRDEYCPLMDAAEDIKGLQTYKMFEGDEELYVELDDVLDVLGGE